MIRKEHLLPETIVALNDELAKSEYEGLSSIEKAHKLNAHPVVGTRTKLVSRQLLKEWLRDRGKLKSALSAIQSDPDLGYLLNVMTDPDLLYINFNVPDAGTALQALVDKGVLTSAEKDQLVADLATEPIYGPSIAEQIAPGLVVSNVLINELGG